MKDNLLRAIEHQTANLVVLGLGYVGLPVACLFAQAGFSVLGLERRQDKVDKINRGECPIDGKEPGLAELMSQMVAEGKFTATPDYQVCKSAQIVLLAVETPIDPSTKKPDYQALTAALTDLGPHLARGTMVIIESTIAPGTMAMLVKPLLEEQSGLRVNEDFYLVHCPERVMPGKLLANIHNCHRVVGGMSPEAAEIACHFYRYIVEANLDPVDCLTAELVKTMENAYRDVQIAFANEMALLCEDMGADVWQIRELVNKSPYRQMHLPGAGVGGHCIPKDPWLLIANASYGFEPRMIRTARAINDHMPLHMADLTLETLSEVGIEIGQAKVLVLGYSYLENADDTRNSFSAVMVEHLHTQGAEVVIHDPWIPQYQGDLLERAAGCDVAVLMVKHQSYYHLDLGLLRKVMRTPIFIDGRHVFDSAQAQAAGLIYRGLGQGTKPVGVELGPLTRAAELFQEQAG
ncbi:MAG: nucleotide sugar dehydrogenase [Anaerolineae bacterium]|nr:nucleotide sugar dehydrogenase [Anaerolineae bacterium]